MAIAYELDIREYCCCIEGNALVVISEGLGGIAGKRTSWSTDEISAYISLTVSFRRSRGEARTYHCFGMVQSDTPGQTALRQKPEVGDCEFVELWRREWIGQSCLGSINLPPSEQAA